MDIVSWRGEGSPNYKVNLSQVERYIRFCNSHKSDIESWRSSIGHMRETATRVSQKYTKPTVIPIGLVNIAKTKNTIITIPNQALRNVVRRGAVLASLLP
jgi:hypothetical protein